jgi:hypothetical protein
MLISLKLPSLNRLSPQKQQGANESNSAPVQSTSPCDVSKPLLDLSIFTNKNQMAAESSIFFRRAGQDLELEGNGKSRPCAATHSA